MKTDKPTKPYTYLIGWTEHGKFYFGVRFGRGCCPADLWVRYFTSSPIVKKMREELGEPDIRWAWTEESREAALESETKFLQQFVRNGDRETFVNQNIAGQILHTAETIEKIRQSSLLRRHNSETKARIGQAAALRNTGKVMPPRTEEHRRNITNARLGVSSRKIPICIDGKNFSSLRQAAKCLGISEYMLSKNYRQRSRGKR